MTPSTSTPTTSSMQNTLNAIAFGKASARRNAKHGTAKRAVKLPTPAEAKDQLFSSLRVLRKKSSEYVNFTGKLADLGLEPHTPEILELVAEVRRFTDPQLPKLLSELEKSVLRAEKDAQRLWRGSSYAKVFLTPKSDKQKVGWLEHVKGQLQRSKVEVETVAGLTMPGDVRGNAERAIANAKKILFFLQNPPEDAKVKPEDLRFANVYVADKMKNGGHRRGRRFDKAPRTAADDAAAMSIVEVESILEEVNADCADYGKPKKRVPRQSKKWEKSYA